MKPHFRTEVSVIVKLLIELELKCKQHLKSKYNKVNCNFQKRKLVVREKN